MPVVALPDNPRPREAEWDMLDFGGLLTPALGGRVQRLNRLGQRHAVDVTMPPMRYAEALKWVQRLKRGLNEGVVMPVTQPDFVPEGGPADNVYVSSTVSGGRSLPIYNIYGSALKEGQFFSVYHAGRSYLYSLDADVTIVAGSGGTGSGVISFSPTLRTSIFGGSDVLNFVTPRIEGNLVGDSNRWSVDAARTVGLRFRIEEAE